MDIPLFECLNLHTSHLRNPHSSQSRKRLSLTGPGREGWINCQHKINGIVVYNLWSEVN